MVIFDSKGHKVFRIRGSKKKIKVIKVNFLKLVKFLV